MSILVEQHIWEIHLFSIGQIIGYENILSYPSLQGSQWPTPIALALPKYHAVNLHALTGIDLFSLGMGSSDHLHMLSLACCITTMEICHRVSTLCGNQVPLVFMSASNLLSYALEKQML